MAEYIDRNKAIQTALDAVDDWDGGRNLHRASIIYKYFNAQPAVDVRENVKGEWEYVDYILRRCSNCGKEAAQSHFCPNCGAKMEANDEL